MRFKEFKDSWNKVQLKNIVEINPKSENLPNEFIYIDLESVKNGELIKKEKFSIHSAPLRAKRLLKFGDILYSCVRPYQHNNIIFKGTSNTVASTGFACLRNASSSEFLYEAINTKAVEIKVMERCTGTSYPAINTYDLGNIDISIPSEKEQKKLGYFMSILNIKINTQKKIIEDLIILKNNIINNIYGTKKYNCKLDNCVTQVSNRNKNSKINLILSVSNKLGFIKQSEQFEEREVASDDVTNYKIIEKNMLAYNPARINVGSIAKYNLNTPGIVSPMYICFKTNNNNIDANYLNYYFSSNEFKKQMRKRLEGSVRLCLTYESMINIPFYLPSVDIQKKNAALLTAFTNKIDFEKKYLSLLESQKTYLLNKMFI